MKATDWALYQYHIDFSPEEDRTAVRKGLLRVHQKSIGAYIFDGTLMYTSHRLSDVSIYNCIFIRSNIYFLNIYLHIFSQI